MGRHIGYIRVSSVDQNTNRQLVDVSLDLVYEDKVSGKDRVRPELTNMIKAVTHGDTVHVHSMDRLARNVVDLLDLVKEINGKGASVAFHKEGRTFVAGKEDSESRLMLTILGAVAEFERAILKERQREGIAVAKAKGVYSKHGRKQEVTPEKVQEIRDRVAAGEKKASIARSLKISRDTLYRHLNE